MIFNQWYIILDSKELKKRNPLQVKRLNETLVLWRDSNGKACCIDDKCCHRGASLACGKNVNGHVECPFHGFLYDSEGKVRLIPANGKSQVPPEHMKVRSYKTFEANGFIWIWYGDKDKITGEPFFFEELKNFSYSTFRDHWSVHYSRAIENQLDVVHLPFVHRTTIGRGERTLVNGPVVEREGDLLTFYVDNRKDDGKKVPLKPDEIPDYKDLFKLQFHFPNIWQNCISDKMRAFAAFVPIDDENTLIYIRYYQGMFKIPILKQFFNWTGKVTSKIILRQDKRVVITQLPKKSDLKMKENLITGDLPIVEYRRHREFLITRE